MAKKSAVVKYEKCKALIEKYSVKRQEILKKMYAADSEQAFEKEFKALNKMKRNTSRTRLKRRCRQCGRPKGIYRRFGLCRVCIRNAAMRGDIPGLAKASW